MSRESSKVQRPLVNISRRPLGEASRLKGSPRDVFRGLIDLFGYYEPVPECEWSAARNSLSNLATSLERVEKELFSSIRFADQGYIQETRLYYDTIIGKLRRAGDLFLPGHGVC